MGEHKTNPTALAAKRGELLPKQKPKRMSKKKREALIRKQIHDKTGLPKFAESLGAEYFYI